MNTPKLPLFPTIIGSYRILFGNLGLYARLIWFPLIVCCAFYSLKYFLENGTATDSKELMNLLSMIMVGFLAFLLTIPAIVSWHQFIILGEYKNSVNFRLSFRREEWGYLIEFITFVIVFGFFLALIYGGINAGLSSIVQLGPSHAPSIEGRIVLSLASAIASLPVSYFLVILPSVAIGKRASYRKAKKILKGNLLRVWAVYILAMVPERLIFHILEVAEEYTGSIDIGGVFNGFDLLSILNNFLFFTISVGVLSIAYQFCAEGRASQLEPPMLEN